MIEVPYSHIACCIEESAGSERALSEARRLRAFGPGRLTLIHVAPQPIVYGEGLGVPPADEITGVASAWLAGKAAKAPEVQQVLLSGHPASSVCDWAREHRPDLLVAGAYRGHLARVALGSFAS
jgi:nucleotide-binding universal stress UspA family protein